MTVDCPSFSIYFLLVFKISVPVLVLELVFSLFPKQSNLDVEHQRNASE
jgi:hypothetical protein